MARKKQAAHHGGAWKVAYADFVTAMMALFMVLWICAQDKKILIATSRYFQNPFTSPMEASSGVLPSDNSKAATKGEDSGADSKDSSMRQVDLQFLNSVAKDFYRLLNLDDSVDDKPLDIQVTSNGLRLTLYDRARRPLFVENTAEFTDWGRFVMQSMAWLIDRHHFYVVIEGHTRAGLKLPKPEYSAWELSTDRAQAARRALTFYAVDEKLIDWIAGYAATRPDPKFPPDSETNQRVTLSLSVGRAKSPKPEGLPAKTADLTASSRAASSSGTQPSKSL
jgi:chemotaxis protein MotB